jgi:8-oxo-dGTP pyrophosphatase MutT (NUDIX family)
MSPRLDPARRAVLTLLDRHDCADAQEARDVAFIGDFVRRHADCFARTCAPGHLTASAYIVDPEGERLLLIHHRKLERWLQPGGHLEPGEIDLLRAAWREAHEETGLAELVPLGLVPIDIDVHRIPERGAEPAHDHLDFRFAFRAPDPADLARCAEETTNIRWFGWEELGGLELDPAFARAIGKVRRVARGS